MTNEATYLRTPQLKVLLLGLVTVVSSVLLYRFIPHGGFVTELTAAGGIFADANKLADFYIVPVAVGIQIAGMAMIWWFDHRNGASPPSGGAFNAVTALVLAVALIFWMFFRGSWGAVIAPLSIVSGYLLCHSRDKSEGPAAFSAALIAAAAMTFVANRYLALPVVWTFSILFLPLGLFFSFAARTWLLPLCSTAAGVILLGQLVMSAPFFWLPKAFTHGVSGIDFAVWGLAIIVAWQAVKSVWLDEPRRSSPLLLALALFLVTTLPFNPFYLPFDDYHFGEVLLANDAISQGWHFFVEFLSPHGLIDARGSLRGILINDQSVSGVLTGDYYVLAAIKFSLFWLMIRFSGAFLGSLALLVLPDENLLYGPMLLGVLIIQAGLIRNSVISGGLVVALCAAGIMTFGGVGVAVAVPSFLAVLCAARRPHRKELIIFLAAAAVFGTVFVCVFAPQVLGQMQFLKDSTVSNLNIYGNGQLGRLGGYLVSPIIFALLPLVAFSLLYSLGTGKSGRPSWRSLSIFILPVVLIVLLYNSYAMSRLDGQAPRAYAAATTILVSMICWLAALGLRNGFSTISLAQVRLRQAILVLLLFAATLSFSSSIERMNTFNEVLPPTAIALPPPIDPAIPYLGFGSADPAHKSRIQVVKRLIDQVLLPDETFVDLSNRNAFYFYFDQKPPARVSSVYNAAARGLQQDMLSDLEKARPELALVSVDNFNHDGGSLPLRSFLIYQYVLDNYTPFAHGPYIFAIRNDLADRAAGLSAPLQFGLNPVSDANWSNGVAIGENAKTWSFALKPEMAEQMRPGDVLMFSDGIERTVTDASGMNVQVSPPLEAREGERVLINMGTDLAPMSAQQLWSFALKQQYLEMLPSAWGRSEKKLQKAFAGKPIAWNLRQTHDADVPGEGKGYRVTGEDPHWIFEPKRDVSPRENGILRVETACMDASRIPRVKIYWRSSAEGYAEERSVSFTATYPVNLVPLDASPDWLLSSEVLEVRIDVDGCEAVRIEPPALLSRAAEAAI